jgi:DNA invertase Pin-like site-specific DNA recombinase
MKVATYSRVSTAQHQSTEAQVAELRLFCHARGWEVAHEIADHGYSGGTDNRPGLKELFSLVRQRKVDAVGVVKMDRLFRSLRHLVVTLEELESLGVTFVAVRDNVDWSTPAGRFFIQILGSLAEFEKSIIRERIMAGIKHARNKGKRLGRPRLHREHEILRLRGQGLSHRQIARRLGVSKGLVYRVLKDQGSAQKTSSEPPPEVPGTTGGCDA